MEDHIFVCYHCMVSNNEHTKHCLVWELLVMCKFFLMSYGFLVMIHGAKTWFNPMNRQDIASSERFMSCSIFLNEMWVLQISSPFGFCRYHISSATSLHNLGEYIVAFMGHMSDINWSSWGASSKEIPTFYILGVDHVHTPYTNANTKPGC